MKPSPTHYPITPALQAYIALSTILVALAFFSVTARFISRTTGPGLGWDDGLILFAAPLGLALLIIEGLLSTIGLGYHADAIPAVQLQENMFTILPLNTAFTLCYIPAIAIVKCSMLLSYRRLFTSKKTRLSIHVALGFVIAWFITHLCTSLLSCRPIDTLWDPVAPGHCYNSTMIVVVLAAVNVATDMAIMAIPSITVITKLSVSRADKIGVLFLIFLGFLVTIASCVRMYFYTAVKALDDWTGSMPTVIFASIFEVNLAIIISSVPMIRPLWKRFRARRNALEFKDREQDDYTSRGYQLSARHTADLRDAQEMKRIAGPRSPAGYPKGYNSSISRPDSWPAPDQYLGR